MKKPYVIIGIIILALLCFHGGMKYGENSSTGTTPAGSASAGQAYRTGRTGAAGGLGGGISGNIVNNDGQTLTVGLAAGGSEVVIVSSSTRITQTVDAPVSALAPGSEVMVIGATDSAGAVDATSIQVRPGTSTQSQQTSGQQ